MTFEAEGQTYTLRLGTNEMANLMAHWAIRPTDGETLFIAMAQLKSPLILRDVVLFGLRRKHPEITPDAAGDLIDAVGLDRTGELIAEALRWALPPPPEGAEAGRDADDPKAGGTSSGS